MWQVEHQCTQCGAAVVLEEAQRVFKCPFCRVKLYISPGDFFRYYLAPAPGIGEAIFVPYWRFKGMAFSFTGAEIGAGLVDVSRNATRFDFLPSSLGLRSQTQKLRFLSPAVQGSFLERNVALEDTLALDERFAPAGLVRPKMTYIGESLNVIYSPVYLRNVSVYDGLAGERIAPLPEDEDFFGRGGPSRPPIDSAGRLDFIPCICPDCGADMEGEAQSAIMTCSNCLSAWRVEGNYFIKIPSSFAPAYGEAAVFLPFWRIEAVSQGIIESRAEAARIMGLPVAVMKDWENEPFLAVVPAFKVSPDLFLRIAKVMSFHPEEVSLEEGCPRGKLFPATLPLTEARESLRIVLAYSSPAKKAFEGVFPKLDFARNSAVLVWMPFVPAGMELVRPDRKFGISASALKWGQGI